MTTFKRLKIVVLGLCISSSWGNIHATTYRSLIKGLKACGHRIVFLERDVPWFASRRDMITTSYCCIYLYQSLLDLKKRFQNLIEEADCIIVGSSLQEGIGICSWVQKISRGITAFYDMNTPVTLSMLKHRKCDYISAKLIPGFNIYLSITGGPIIRALTKIFHASNAVVLYSSFDIETYFPQMEEESWDLGFFGTYHTEKQLVMNRFFLDIAVNEPQFQFVFAGPQQITEMIWPLNVDKIDHLSPEQQRNFYCSQRFTLILTGNEMKKWGYSPNVQLFEAAACATPIISDLWEGLDMLFQPDREILIAHNRHEVLEILSDITDKERRLIGQRAYERVVSEHTSLHRALQLEKYLLEE